MNKKEISEIKKHFGVDADFFTINSILTAFIDRERNVHSLNVKPFVAIPPEESEISVLTLKKVLNTSLGKSSVEYIFPNEAYADDGAQKVLYNLVQCKMQDEQAVNAFISRLAENSNGEAPYAVICAHCTYSIRSKNKNDEYNLDENENLYNYIITAICPVATAEGGLVFDNFNDEIINKTYTDLQISKSPSDGFIFPTFSDRATDVNHVMYYTKSPSKPNEAIIAGFLGCEAGKSYEEEREGLKTVIKNVMGDDLDYRTLTSVNEKLTEIVEESKKDTEAPLINGRMLKNILADTGAAPERLEHVEEIFEKSAGQALQATRLVEPKTVIATPEITINVKNCAKDKVRTTTVNGRRCIIIDLDEANIKVNGYDLKLDCEQ